MEDFLVSIAIPAYKPEYLFESIQSALKQDYSNIELIIVDDDSPYEIGSIVESFQDFRVKYYKNKYNLGKKGVAKNWNKCLEYAQGDFFVLLCDDDVLMPNFVSELLKLSRKYPQCNVFHSSRCILNMSTGNVEFESPWNKIETHEEYVESFMRGRRHSITEFMYRTDHIKALQFQDFPVGYYSDNASIMLFSRGGIIVSSPERLAIFRQSEIHITSNLSLNPQKAHAATCFIKWLKKREICENEYQENRRRMEYEALTYLYGAQSWTKLKVLFHLPFSIITFKGVCRHCIYLIRKHLLRVKDREMNQN